MSAMTLCKDDNATRRENVVSHRVKGMLKCYKANLTRRQRDVSTWNVSVQRRYARGKIVWLY